MLCTFVAGNASRMRAPGLSYTTVIYIYLNIIGKTEGICTVTISYYGQLFHLLTEIQFRPVDSIWEEKIKITVFIIESI